MAWLTDAKRRLGIGAEGFLLWAILAGGGIAYALFAGDLRESATGVPIEVLVPGVIYGLAAFGVVVGVWHVPTSLRLRRSRQHSTGDVARRRETGSVVCEGTVATRNDSLETPVKQTEAVVYTTRIQRNRVDDEATVRAGEGEGWWLVHVGEETTPFALDDGTGAVPIEPAGASLRLDDPEEMLVFADDELPSDLRSYVEEARLDVDTDAHLQVEEAALEPGETAVVIGHVDGTTIDATLVGDGSYIQRVYERVVVWGSFSLAVAVVSFGVLLWAANVV